MLKSVSFILVPLIVGSLFFVLPPFSCARDRQKMLFGVIFLDILDVETSVNIVNAGATINVVTTVNASWDVFDFSSFFVETYYDSCLIDSHVFYILGMGQEMVNFTSAWNTTGVEPGSYTISAKAYGSYIDTYIDGIVQILPIPRTWTVDDDGPADFPTIQEAITASSDGDTIFVRNGTYSEKVVVSKAVSLVGENRNSSIIEGHYTYLQSAVSIYAAKSCIRGFTIQDGWCGVAVFSNSCIVAQNIITNNTYAGGGGQIYESGRGIWSLRTINVTMIENIVSSNDRGICLEEAERNIVEGNTILNSAISWGILLESSSNNSIRNNFVKASAYDGIYLAGSDSNEVIGNFVEANGDEGVYLGSSDNNILAENTVVDNLGEGVWLDWSNNSRIVGNNVSDNRKRGILCSFSSNASVYHNNFVNNSWGQAYSDALNAWDSGCEGNFWSDYSGTDLEGDGVGDTPYVIVEDNADNYPLMNVFWNPCDINHDLKVDMNDIGRSARAFNTVPGDLLWNPHVDITGPEYLVPDSRVDMRDISLIATHFMESCQALHITSLPYEQPQ